MDNGASSYRRYLNGDESAFAELVKEYFDNLVFFVDRYVQDYGAAEDIALDVFTQLVVHKHRYNFSVSLKTYLFMLGRSRALDYIKHRNKYQMTELKEEMGIPSDEPPLEDMLLTDARKKAVHSALKQLDAELRLVIHLIYFEELTADEAGKVLKKNRKQIYYLLYRGKNALRTILGEEGEQLL